MGHVRSSSSPKRYIDPVMKDSYANLSCRLLEKDKGDGFDGVPPPPNERCVDRVSKREKKMRWIRSVTTLH